MNKTPQQGSDPIGCGCDEFPECTHALYFYMGAKHAAGAASVAQGKLREALIEAVEALEAIALDSKQIDCAGVHANRGRAVLDATGDGKEVGK